MKTIGQIALTVSDIEKAMVFYRDTVGLTYMFHNANVALFDVNGIRLMLGKEQTGGKNLYGTIIYYKVNDLEAEFRRLRGTDADVVEEPRLVAKFGGKDIWIASFLDLDGNIFALMEEK
jgi:predicted enzyme related to lactoylglutathione lyase